MSTLDIKAPKDIESLYTFTDDASNPELFESWKPKIQAYRDELDKNTLKEYRVPESDIPSDIDTKIFNTVEFLSKSTALTEKEKEITSMSATELADKIAKSELSSVEVLKAFAHRAVILQQCTNFAMDFFIHEGLKRAEELDDYLEKW